VLESLPAPAQDPDASWFLRVLADEEKPRGVRRSATGGDPLMTHCSAVVDLTARQVTLQAREHRPVTVPWNDLVPEPSPAQVV
jgi:hypothetical protein